VSFIIENTVRDFENCPPGLHLSRCYRIIDLGTQRSEYKGQVKTLHKIMFAWEIHGFDEDGKDLRMKDGRPFAIFKNYTLSWSDKANLRNDLQAWRGKPFTDEEMRKFDLKNVLGAWCMLNIIHRTGESGGIYANVNGITPVPAVIKQQGFPQPVNENQIFNLSDPDMDIFATFSDNLKKKIEAAPEWEKAKNGGLTVPEISDDPNQVPF
jgi:hypothetical protein